jgi:hypothetical protein
VILCLKRPVIFLFQYFPIFNLHQTQKHNIMKNTLLVLVALVCFGITRAQDSKKVFGSLGIGWYGVDFTRARMIGFKDDSPHKIRDEYFKAWNDVSIDVDMMKVFQKKTSFKYPNDVLRMDLARETDNLVTADDKDLTPDDIADMVKKIPQGQKKEGLGVLFIVQSFNKPAATAIMYVTFFDIATHNVLLSKMVTGKPSGGANKTAWAAAIKSVFDKVEKTEFSAWKKEANY